MGGHVNRGDTRNDGVGEGEKKTFSPAGREEGKAKTVCLELVSIMAGERTPGTYIPAFDLASLVLLRPVYDRCSPSAHSTDSAGPSLPIWVEPGGMGRVGRSRFSTR